jgi:TonB-dependent receptor
MKTSIYFPFFMFLFAITSSVVAQTGTIRGTIFEDSTGDPILFGNVQVVGNTIATTSDLDGAYTIELEPGTYSILFTYIGFSDLTISDVVVTDGQITTLDVRIKETSELIDEVVITAQQARNTEAALATIKKRSSNVIDGISAASFRKTGDSDAAAAVKRVTGVSIEGGKYVYVRGLGDRYTKSILNGMDIPGLDPDRNTLQMDIFPTNIIDNIIILKSFTADLPADFTGGVVDITTKDFPEEKTASVSMGIGYNPSMHFNSDYLTYDGGGTDFLGFDDGTREIPTGKSTDIPTRVDVIRDPARAQEFNSILTDFNPTLAGYRNSSLMDYNLGFSVGNQINKDKFTLGYNLALTYKNSTDFYEDAVNARFGRGNSSSETELEQREFQIGEFGTNNVLLGGMAGLSLKSSSSKISLNLLRLQNGEKTAGLFNFVGSDQGSNFQADQHNLEYSERSITNALLQGKHSLGEGKTTIDWKLSPTVSTITDPDIRFTRIRTDNNELSIGTESGIPQRIWRFLDEINLAGKAGLTKEYTFNEEKAKFQVGGSYTYKQRDYEIQGFGIFPGNAEVTEDPNTLFTGGNFFSPSNLSGLYYNPQFIPNNVNKYDADISSIGAYVSNEFSPLKKLKAIIGVRMESYTQRYTGINQSNETFDNVTVIDDLDFFPTANFILGVTENQNFRASYTRTIARPSFKEASFATIIDPLSGRTFIGGFFPDVDVSTGETIWDGNLKTTSIQNVDLRYEYFQPGGQNISISGFYKHFTDPIEIVQYVQAANNFQPRNVGTGKVLGVEFEFRKNLGRSDSFLGRLTANGNVTVTQSDIEMSETEFRSRQQNARDGQTIDNFRDMAGQAPYIINGGISYNSENRNFELGFFYNVQGRTLQFVGIADRPDVYSVPFHSLNVTSNYSFGPEEKYRLSLKAENLLGSKRESVFESFNAADQLFQSLAPQTSIGASISVKI